MPVVWYRPGESVITPPRKEPSAAPRMMGRWRVEDLLADEKTADMMRALSERSETLCAVVAGTIGNGFSAASPLPSRQIAVDEHEGPGGTPVLSLMQHVTMRSWEKIYATPNMPLQTIFSVYVKRPVEGGPLEAGIVVNRPSARSRQPLSPVLPHYKLRPDETSDALFGRFAVDFGTYASRYPSRQQPVRPARPQARRFEK